jgi:hypothetical protein
MLGFIHAFSLLSHQAAQSDFDYIKPRILSFGIRVNYIQGRFNSHK